MAELDLPSQELDLIELALRLRWSSVAARATLIPEEIVMQDQDGLNVLHWACCNPPPLAAFQALLRRPQAIKQAACAKDNNGMTPLLCACASQAPVDMISALVEVCPECVPLTDSHGWTALFYVCCRAKQEDDALRIAIRKAKILLHANSSLALHKDSFGATALSILCGLFEMELQGAYFMLTNIPSEGSSILLHFDDLWTLLRLIVESTETPASESTILHKVVSFPSCPHELLMFAYSRHSDMALQQDSNGNTPLHLAVQQESLHNGSFLAQNERRAAKVRNKKGETPLLMATQRFQYFNSLICYLLYADTKPLESLRIPDQYYPFLLERVKDDPSVIFGVLKSRPSLARMAKRTEGKQSATISS